MRRVSHPDESECKLKELAGGGHLEVRVRGGGLYYALRDVSRATESPESHDERATR